MKDSDKINVNEEVELLVKKAAEAEKADDAMKFSQAACNVADAVERVNSQE